MSIHITPTDENGDQYITVTLKNGDTTATPINKEKLQEKLPPLVKFGFSASTGANNDVHFIRGLEVKTVQPVESGILMTKEVNHDTTQGGVDSSKTTFAADETVPYTFVVQNTGGKTLTNVHIDDPRVTNVHLQGSDATSTTLEPGQQAVFYGSLVLTEDQAREGSLTNTATATGIDGEKDITDESSVTITTEIPLEPVEPLGEPDHSKKIGDNGDGTYTLALDVTGASNEQIITTTTPLDIVLVLDTSGSMDDDMGEGGWVDSYDAVSPQDVVESTGRVFTDQYWEGGFFGHWVEYQHAQQTTRGGEYYVKVGDEYVHVNEVTHTVNGDCDTSYEEHDAWQVNGQDVDPSTTTFYEHNQGWQDAPSKMDALQEAADEFINSVASMNDDIADTNQQHRIALVKFASNNSNSIGNDFTRDGYNYSQIVSGLRAYTSADASSLTDTVDGLRPTGATQADYGLAQAQRALNGTGSTARPNAKKVVIFFTDGEPSTWDSWSGQVAADAINTAHDMKEAGVTVYSIGVFDGANPNDTRGDFNKYMNAVSSNYPDAECANWRGQQTDDFDDLDMGDSAPSDEQYYFSAENADQLNQVFEDITSSITQGSSYTKVSIVDELSEYAQADGIQTTGSADKDGFFAATGITVTVKDASGANQDIPEGTQKLFKPADDTQNGTVKVVFPDNYKLGVDWTYTVTFNVKPTDKAYEDYANGGYTDTGDPNTDLYETVTSSNQLGFYSNENAYVAYTANDKEETAKYDKPVLQVKATQVGGLEVVKNVTDGELTAGEFDFTVTAVGTDGENGSTADEAAKFAWGSDDRLTLQQGNGEEGENSPVNLVHKGGMLTLTSDDAGKSYSYVYTEDQDQETHGYALDKTAWKVVVTVNEDATGATATVYKDADGADESGAYSWVACGQDLKPVDESGQAGSWTLTADGTPVLILPFTNEYQHAGLVIHKNWTDTDDPDDPDRQPLEGAKFAIFTDDGDGVYNADKDTKPAENIYASNTWTDADAAMTEAGFATNNQGVVSFYGLTPGTYWVVEVEVPAGYNVVAPTKLVVTDDNDDGQMNYEWGGTSDNLSVSNNVLTVSMTDLTLKPLPQTGSSGTIAVSAAGVATAALAGVYLFQKRKGLQH